MDLTAVTTKKKLRSGYTTGACATAAALGAALMLRDQRLVAAVELTLPTGQSVTFALAGQTFDRSKAACFVIKDAGDDPDVTHGVEMHAQVTRCAASGIELRAGTGIGTVTKPGLPVPVGEPAINPVPRQMLTAALTSVFSAALSKRGVVVTLSIPDGEKRAERTLNARLGILGGLSILGTTGIVRPVSHRAWTDTIDVSIDVALASGCGTVVLVTGRTSELVAQAEFDLPEEAYIMMGDHVGYALKACERKQVPRIVVAAQFAKLLKIACGHRQTHVDSSRLDLAQLAVIASAAGLDDATCKAIECANTAREVFTSFAGAKTLTEQVAKKALAQMRDWISGQAIELLLIGYDGTVAGRFPAEMTKGDL
jgi:cobalt-precorrin-5B (C1)-methyltransferase